jgi:hypothetical protein
LGPVLAILRRERCFTCARGYLRKRKEASALSAEHNHAGPAAASLFITRGCDVRWKGFWNRLLLLLSHDRKLWLAA